MRFARVAVVAALLATASHAEIIFRDGFENGKIGYWTNSESEPPFCPNAEGLSAPFCAGSPSVPDWLTSCTFTGAWPEVVCHRRCYNTWGFDACLDLQVLEDPFPEP